METTLLQDNQPASMDGFFLQKQIEILIDINNKKLAGEFKKINEAIIRLNEEVSDLRRQLNEGLTVQRAQSPRAEPAPIANASQDNPTSPREHGVLKSSEQLLRQRCGDYTSEDVSVSKFFYFGNKKK